MKLYSNADLNEVKLATLVTLYTQMFIKCQEHICKFTPKDLMRAYVENLDLLDFLDNKEDFNEYSDETLIALNVYVPMARDFCSNVEEIFSEGLEQQMIYFDVERDFEEEKTDDSDKTDC